TTCEGWAGVLLTVAIGVAVAGPGELVSLGWMRREGDSSGTGVRCGLALGVGFGLRSGFSSGSGVGLVDVLFFFFVGGCLAGLGLRCGLAEGSGVSVPTVRIRSRALRKSCFFSSSDSSARVMAPARRRRRRKTPPNQENRRRVVPKRGKGLWS